MEKLKTLMTKEVPRSGTFAEIINMAVLGYRTLACELVEKADALEEANSQPMEPVAVKPTPTKTRSKLGANLMVVRSSHPKKGKRKISAAGRERIRQAQLNRWAAIRQSGSKNRVA